MHRFYQLKTKRYYNNVDSSSSMILIQKNVTQFLLHFSNTATSQSSSSSSSSSSSAGQYLTLDLKDILSNNGVAVVRLNNQNKSVNTLCAGMTHEFEDMLNIVEQDDRIHSVVLMSDKPKNFIAGADIEELEACQKREEMLTLSRHGQAFLSRLANSAKPFVAAMDGATMGGGLEVALACHYRIASESKSTLLSLPEVQLGLLPGAGGTQRLPRLVGLQESLGMMLKGGPVRPAKAKKIGLVDSLADSFALEKAAIQAAQNLANGTLKRKTRKKSLVDKVIESSSFTRTFAINQARKAAAKMTKGHYPAPNLICDAVETGLNQGLTKGLESEAQGFATLGMTSVSKACISIFFGQTELKKNRYGKPDMPIQTMAVLGAGLMGAGIAEVSASKGVRVLLKDQSAASASKGAAHVASGLNQKVKRRQMTAYDRDLIMSRVIPLSDEDDVWKKHIASADLVIEAVFEDMGLKHKVVKELEQYVKDDCIIATNTSALSVADIASVSRRPENVLGMHYFSPVPKMPLLEIIRHESNTDEVVGKAIDLGNRQGKTCIIVKDVPGFYVNRCLGPYIAETLALVQDGVSPEKLDNILTDYGFPVGPITLADEVGIDVASHVNATLTKALGVRMAGGNPQIFQDMIAKGLLGKKTSKGFFIPGKTKKEKKQFNPEATECIKAYLGPDLKLDDETTRNRLLSRFVNEAVLCVQDDIVASPTEGDIGAVFGVGFPPYIGGPFRFVDLIGSQKFNDMMLSFADKYGPQFEPCQLIKDMAKTNKRFHKV